MSDMTAMIGPDGSPALVPAEQVQEAVKQGAKVGVHMRGPDGSEAVVPTESLSSALKAGASPVTPAAMAKASIPAPPTPNMQEEDLAGPLPTNPVSKLAGRVGDRMRSNLNPINVADSVTSVIDGVKNYKDAGLSNVLDNLKKNVGAALSQYKDPANVLGDIGTGLLTHGMSDAAPAIESAPKGSPAPTVTAPPAPEPPLGRFGRVANVIRHDVPGFETINKVLKAGKLPGKLAEAWNGPTPPSPPPPTPSVPEIDGIPLGSGGQGPLSLRGKMIPPEAPPANQWSASTATDKIPAAKLPPPSGPLSRIMPEPEAAPQLTEKEAKAALANLLGKATGATDLKPNVKLSQQLPALMDKTSDIPEGHTPIDSTKVASYMHDPESQNFEYSLKDGSAYRHGPVDPEDVKAFEDAKSKGKAVQVIKDKTGSPLAKKYKGGNWINLRRATVTPEVP